MATDSSNPLQQYGYDQKTGQALADSLGITTQQLAAAFEATPLTGGGQTGQGKFMGGSSVSQDFQPPGRDLNATVQQLRMAKAAGMGGSGAGQAGQAGTFASGPVDYSGSRAAVNLGAAALGAAGFSGAEGAYPIYNPIPGQINSAKGGVQTNVPSPVVANAIPNVQKPNVASVFGQPSQESQGLQYWGSQAGGGSATDAASIEKAQGWAPGTIGKKFYEAGVQAGKINPAGNNPAPTSGGTPTATTPANAGAGQPATPWATAPAAPGAQVQGMPDWAHAGALADAGKAMFAHMTGNNPADASHADIMDFHNKLTSMIGAATGSAGQQGQPPANLPASGNLVGWTPTPPAGGPSPMQFQGVPGNLPGISGGPPAFGSAPVTPPPITPPKQMAVGGFVPGQGSGDTVPALLTPGEYVIPKQQAAQIFGGRAPVRMQSGGFVPDDQDQKRPPPEVRRQKIVPPGAPPAAPGPEATSSGSSQSSQGDSGTPSTPSYQGNSPLQWAQLAQQARAAQAANANVGSGGPGSIDALGTLGDESIITGQGGPGQPGGPGSATMAASGAISDLANGLTKAAQAYEKSIKPWQMIAQQFGKGGTPNYQNVNFQQDTTV